MDDKGRLTKHDRIKNMGGFKWKIKRSGEKLYIIHNHQTIEIQFNGNEGTGKWSVNVNGPKSFYIATEKTYEEMQGRPSGTASE